MISYKMISQICKFIISIEIVFVKIPNIFILIFTGRDPFNYSASFRPSKEEGKECGGKFMIIGEVGTTGKVCNKKEENPTSQSLVFSLLCHPDS